MPKSDRIIIDTNLWISFLIKNDYAKLDHLLSAHHIIILFSEELLQEFVEVASRPKLKKYFQKSSLKMLLVSIEAVAEFIEVTSDIKDCRDAKDNFLLSLARDGKATHLITGDKDLLDIMFYEETRVLTFTEYFNDYYNQPQLEGL